MPRYAVFLAASAAKDLDGLPATLERRVIDKLDSISNDPRGPDSKKLDDLTYRVRVGDYRIVYHVDDAKKTVIVTRIRHRREVYRRNK
jgi:mRNA interferase RelE/StbE